MKSLPLYLSDNDLVVTEVVEYTSAADNCYGYLRGGIQGSSYYPSIKSYEFTDLIRLLSSHVLTEVINAGIFQFNIKSLSIRVVSYGE